MSRGAASRVPDPSPSALFGSRTFPYGTRAAKCSSGFSLATLPFRCRRFDAANRCHAVGGQSTVGGAVAAGLSGPRRPWSGSARDFVLGCRMRTLAQERCGRIRHPRNRKCGRRSCHRLPSAQRRRTVPSDSLAVDVPASTTESAPRSARHVQSGPDVRRLLNIERRRL